MPTAKTFLDISKSNIDDSDIKKFNPYHDRLGRFTSGGSATSFTYKPGTSIAHDKAIQREKELSAGSGSAPKENQPGRGHIIPKSHKERIDTVKHELGCDDNKAKKYAKSIYSFTSENYEAIRAYQQGVKNDYTKKFSRDAKTIEDYIEKAPKWNEGTLYRGINIENGDAKSLFKPGTEMDMKGTSSWSSEKKIADSYTFGSGTKVIFQCDKISKATSVTHLSDNPSEKEVLVSKDTKYISKKVSKKGNIYYVYLDEIIGTSKSFSDVMKFNPYHDRLGRFSSGGSAASFTYKPGVSTAHSKAIEREKEKSGSEKGFKGTLYHGSPNKDIKEFDMKRAGQNTSSGEKLLFFTDSKKMADDFSYERLEGSSTFFQKRGKKGRVYEVDVEMKNPLDLRNLSDKDVDNVLKLDSNGILTKETVKQYANSNHQLLKAGLNLTADSLKDLGYDGLIANTGKAGHNSLEYAVVDSKQAKIRKSDDMALSFSELMKFNPYHDAKGRFTSGSGGNYASFTYSPGKSKAHDNAIAREKERQASYGGSNSNDSSRENSNKIKQEFLDAGLNSKFKGVQRNAKEGKGAYSYKDATPVSESEALKMNQMHFVERDGKTLVHGILGEEKVFYANNSDSKEIKDLRQKSEEMKQKQLEDMKHRPDSITTTSTYDRWKKNHDKNFSDWYGLGKSDSIDSDYLDDPIENENFQIVKSDDDKRLVFGWALVSATSDGKQIIDHQGDIVDQDELEEGAYEYVLNFRDAGEEHIGSLRKKARMVESVVFTEEKLQAMGIPLGTVPYGWWIGFYVDDDDTWEKIKSGHYKMFSIEGRAIREPVNEPLAKSDNEDAGAVAKTFSQIIGNL